MAARAAHLLTTGYQLLVVILLRQSLELLEEHDPPVRGDFEPLVTGLAGHIVVHADEVVFRLFEERPVAGIRASWKLRFLRPPNPSDRVIIRPFAAGALKPGRPLLGLLCKELSFIHIASVHDPRRLKASGYDRLRFARWMSRTRRPCQKKSRSFPSAARSPFH